MRDFEQPGRSVAVARHGMAATSHPLATLAALDILRAGGNAVDAAVAACAVQCVVEPAMTGIGGDCFALLAPAGGDAVVAYNGSGRAPAAATPDWYREHGISVIDRFTPHAATVPGAVDAWTRLVTDHGTMPLAAVLAPAIACARDGFAVTPRVGADWIRDTPVLRRDPNAARLYLNDGEPPRTGSLHRLPELADTLSAIASGGARAFYEGPVAADIVGRLRELGGLHTLDDFAAAGGEYVTPIHTTFRGHEIHECPGNGQGIIALLILNVLSRFQSTADPLDPDRLALEVEATRLGYAARDRYLADHPDVPVEWLLSDRLADQLASRIDLRRAIAPRPTFSGTEHRDTVYLCVVDKDRNAVSFINSLFAGFGSGIVAPKSGVVLHNRATSFVLDPDHSNCIGPGKRPLHTIIPGLMTRAGRAVMPFGVMGGHYQAMGHAHLISKVLDYGMDVQAAIDLPRLYPRHDIDAVETEARIRDTAGPELVRRGFDIVPAPGPIGGGQAIRIDWDTGTLQGGSDARKDGLALGY